MDFQPNFFLVGAERAATTWCWTCLKDHPEVCVAQPKEVHYFDEHFDRGASWYAQHFASAGLPAVGEVNPLYMYSPQVPPRMAAEYPQAQVLAVLRQPFERAVSHVVFAAAAEFGGAAQKTVAELREFASLDPVHVDRSLYHRGLAPFFDLFPREQIHLLFYDTLLANPRQFEQQLYGALRVDDSVSWSGIQRRINEGRDFGRVGCFQLLRRASHGLGSIPRIRRLLEAFHRRFPLRRWLLESLRSGPRRESLAFDEIFGPGDRTRIEDDLERLRVGLKVELPAGWSP